MAVFGEFFSLVIQRVTVPTVNVCAATVCRLRIIIGTMTFKNLYRPRRVKKSECASILQCWMAHGWVMEFFPPTPQRSTDTATARLLNLV